MTKNRFELHEERLASTDEKGHRVYIHPEDVKGPWRNRRTFFYWFLIGLYLVLPWINFQGKQIILLDIPHREFTFFGMTFYAHDAPLFLLVLLGFVFTMGFITSIWGRVWCGWSCPQTVFIDTIYRPIERLIEGKSRQRQKLDSAPLSFEKIWKKCLKWLLYILVTLHISHSLLGYFVGARKLFWITLSPPSEHMTLFIIMLVITGIFLLDFGWFREQFCIIACPYGRLQSVMMDEHSLTVAYDPVRGEPRRGLVDRSQEGDCINCYHCVKACPTGIDIRRGTQLECIACTNCIDACDEIMEKVGKPKGLIRYDTESGLEGRPRKLLKVRSFVYLGAIAAIFGILIYNIINSGNLKATFIRAAKTPYKEVVLNDGSKGVLNLYRVRLDYNNPEKLNIKFQVKNPELRPKIEVITPQNPLNLVGGKSRSIVMHFKFAPEILKKGSRLIFIEFINNKNKVFYEKEVKLVGPLN
jgi:cytochrome c oxidase accessory protein FixG